MSVEDEGATGTGLPLLASSIDHLGGDVVCGVETQGWRGTPGECPVVDDGIGEEGGAVVELEDVTVA